MNQMRRSKLCHNCPLQSRVCLNGTLPPSIDKFLTQTCGHRANTANTTYTMKTSTGCETPQPEFHGECKEAHLQKDWLGFFLSSRQCRMINILKKQTYTVLCIINGPNVYL